MRDRRDELLFVGEHARPFPLQGIVCEARSPLPIVSPRLPSTLPSPMGTTCALPPPHRVSFVRSRQHDSCLQRNSRPNAAVATWTWRDDRVDAQSIARRLRRKPSLLFAPCAAASGLPRGGRRGRRRKVHGEERRPPCTEGRADGDGTPRKGNGNTGMLKGTNVGGGRRRTLAPARKRGLPGLGGCGGERDIMR